MKCREGISDLLNPVASSFPRTVEIEMDSLMLARKEYNERMGLKVSVNDFIIKAAASSLR
jgi:pyruvate/2-oxoglutarate dehydrogenase complex dihydrolipoamide acyltransferase (E2) component